MKRFLKAALILMLAFVMIFSVSCGKKDDGEDKEEKKVEFTANSPLGIAESYVGKDINGLIAELGTLDGEPSITPTNDGGGYEGQYVFDGFIAYTYAKSPHAKAIITEIKPDEKSDVYKESIKEQADGTK